MDTVRVVVNYVWPILKRLIWSTILAGLITIALTVYLYRKSIAYILFGDDRPLTITEINTEKNRKEGGTSAIDYRRRRLRRQCYDGDTGGDDDDDDIAHDLSSFIVKSRPNPVLRSCMRTNHSHSPAVDGRVDPSEPDSSSPASPSQSTPAAPRPSSKPRVRLVEPHHNSGLKQGPPDPPTPTSPGPGSTSTPPPPNPPSSTPAPRRPIVITRSSSSSPSRSPRVRSPTQRPTSPLVGSNLGSTSSGAGAGAGAGGGTGTGTDPSAQNGGPRKRQEPVYPRWVKPKQRNKLTTTAAAAVVVADDEYEDVLGESEEEQQEQQQNGATGLGTGIGIGIAVGSPWISPGSERAASPPPQAGSGESGSMEAATAP